MKRITTPLTDLLNTQSPLAVAPMTFGCDSNLAAQVALAGGYGFLPSGFATGDQFVKELNTARKLLSLSSDAPIPLGVGFLCWMLDNRSETVDVLRVTLERRVQSIWLSFGDDLGRWVRYIRQYDKDRNAPHKTLIWVLVNSVAEAKRAVHEWNADVLVVQGIEAGGHGQGGALPLMTLIPLIKRALPNGPPLAASGGITTGGQAASLLLLGADGCVLGTRYLATHESIYTQNQKETIISASRSIRTRAFDHARGDDPWPEGMDGRAISNKTVEDAARGVPLDEIRRLFGEATRNDDVSRSAVWAGASVALVNEEIGAGALTRILHDETVAHLERSSSLLRNRS